MTPSEEIRAIRATTGLSQQAFGDRYGIPKRTIQNWEAGIREPAPYIITLLRIATNIRTD